MIVIDSREKKKEYFSKAFEKEGVEWIVDLLDVGDFMVVSSTGEIVIVERKDIRDFARSLVDGRLFEQLGRLASVREEYNAIVEVVVEGTIASLSKFSRISRSAIHGALISVQEKFGIPIYFFSSSFDTALHLIVWEKRLSEGKRAREYLKIRKPKTLSDDDVRLAMLAVIPGVGGKKARNLLETFGSVYNVITASEEELRKVRGISTKISRNIIRIVRGAYNGEKSQMD